MTITLDRATAIADSIGPSRVPDGIEDYAADYAAFVTWDREHEHRGILSLEDLLDERRRTHSVNSVRLFMQWARDNGRGPFAVTPVVDAVTPQHLATAARVTPQEFAPWLATFTRWVNEVGEARAGMDPNWLTNTRDLSTLATIEARRHPSQGFHSLPHTRRVFRDWLDANGQTAPDPVAVPQGNTALAFDVTVTAQYLAEHHVELLAPIRDLFIEWAVAHNNGAPSDGNWTNWCLTGLENGHASTFWDNHITEGTWAQDRYLGGFMSWIRQPENASRIPGRTPVVPQGNTAPTFDFDLPMHRWSLEQRRLILEDVIDWQVARPDVDHDRVYQTTNVGYALIPEDHNGGTTGTWSNEEWTPLSEFRQAVRQGTFTLTHTTTEEATTDTTTTGEPVVLPIGPDHPDWQRFAQQMADVATRHGMCPEYERIARMMGLPTRKTRIVTRVTLDIPVEIERGNNVDDRALREAAAALLAQSGTISRANRAEISREEIVAY